MLPLMSALAVVEGFEVAAAGEPQQIELQVNALGVTHRHERSQCFGCLIDLRGIPGGDGRGVPAVDGLPEICGGVGAE